tara:strand:+ start:49801 stop:50616 length:816 start_codon:yes stop_codon:yes gene_type:complete
MNEASAIRRILETLEVPGDGVLQVHASFRGLSQMGWRPDATCEALVDFMRDGTLLMPAMSWSIVTPQHPVFDARSTPCQTGVLSETFRTDFASHRSLHPTHSVCGIGRRADELLSGHALDGTPCGNGSPYGIINGDDTPNEVFVLLIGAGFECCTAIHRPEEVVSPDIYLQPTECSEDYRLIDLSGREIKFSLRRHARRVRDFQQYGHILNAQGALRLSAISDVGFIATDMRHLMNVVFDRLSKDKYAHFPRWAYGLGIEDQSGSCRPIGT